MAKRRSDPSLGDRISEAIKNKGLDDTEAAAAMKISASNLGRIMRGERKTVHFQSGLLLADYLGMDPWELAFGAKRPGTFSVGTGERLPEGPVAEQLANIQAQIDILRDEIHGIRSGSAPKRAPKGRRSA